MNCFGHKKGYKLSRNYVCFYTNKKLRWVIDREQWSIFHIYYIMFLKPDKRKTRVIWPWLVGFSTGKILLDEVAFPWKARRVASVSWRHSIHGAPMVSVIGAPKLIQVRYMAAVLNRVSTDVLWSAQTIHVYRFLSLQLTISDTNHLCVFSSDWN